MHKPNAITDEMYERLKPFYVELLDTKMLGLKNEPVGSVARLVMPRELGQGINDDGKASKTERAMYDRPAEAVQIRRERIVHAISKARVEGYIKVLPLESLACWLPHLEQDEEFQNIDSMQALAVTVAQVPAWVTLTTFYMKTVINGHERIRREPISGMELSPGVFTVGRPSTLTGGSAAAVHFPDASNGFDWVPITEYDPGHLSTATGYSNAQLTAIGALS